MGEIESVLLQSGLVGQAWWHRRKMGWKQALVGYVVGSPDREVLHRYLLAHYLNI